VDKQTHVAVVSTAIPALHVVVTGTVHHIGQTAGQDNSHDLQTEHFCQHKDTQTTNSSKAIDNLAPGIHN